MSELPKDPSRPRYKRLLFTANALLSKFNDKCVVGFEGDISDMQHVRCVRNTSKRCMKASAWLTSPERGMSLTSEVVTILGECMRCPHWSVEFGNAVAPWTQPRACHCSLDTCSMGQTLVPPNRFANHQGDYQKHLLEYYPRILRS